MLQGKAWGTAAVDPNKRRQKKLEQVGDQELGLSWGKVRVVKDRLTFISAEEGAASPHRLHRAPAYPHSRGAI